MTTEAVKTTDQGQTPKYAWVILFAVFFASFVVPVNFFKVPVIFPVFMEEFGFSPDNIGWMMSMFTFISIVLAFPAAGLARKFGYRKVAVVGIGACIAGGLIGVFAPNAGVLLAGRFLEGLAQGFFGVIAPAMLVPWFSRRHFGLAVGIWGIWMPAGGALMQNLTPWLYNTTGTWQSIYWFAIIFSAIILVVFLLLYREAPAGAQVVDEDADAPRQKTNWGKVFSLSLIMAGVMFTIFNLAGNGTINTFLPTFLQMDKGLDNQTSGFVNSVFTIIAILGNAAAGFISDRLGTRKWLIVAGLIGMMIGEWLMFDFISTATMWTGVVITGVFQAFASTCTSASIPEIITDKKNVGWGMAMLGFAA
ncbi:MAG: MFS transporter, partial [Coriobacteriales bacterium]|nr:MFS transporter [Coriobacteriales bacterium]